MIKDAAGKAGDTVNEGMSEAKPVADDTKEMMKMAKEDAKEAKNKRYNDRFIYKSLKITKITIYRIKRWGGLALTFYSYFSKTSNSFGVVVNGTQPSLVTYTQSSIRTPTFSGI